MSFFASVEENLWDQGTISKETTTTTWTYKYKMWGLQLHLARALWAFIVPIKTMHLHWAQHTWVTTARRRKLWIAFHEFPPLELALRAIHLRYDCLNIPCKSLVRGRTDTFVLIMWQMERKIQCIRRWAINIYNTWQPLQCCYYNHIPSFPEHSNARLSLINLLRFRSDHNYLIFVWRLILTTWNTNFPIQ